MFPWAVVSSLPDPGPANDATREKQIPFRQTDRKKCSLGECYYYGDEAPEFPTIAPEFLARLNRSDLVIAHNAAFDLGHLRDTLDHFGLPRPEFDYVCTCQLARRVWPELENHQLSTLTAHIGHPFNHHHAQSDAEAAGRVLLAMMKQVNANTPRELLQKTGLDPKQLRQ